MFNRIDERCDVGIYYCEVFNKFGLVWSVLLKIIFGSEYFLKVYIGIVEV